MKSDERTFQRLQNWYQSLCDGSWEHMYGFTIENTGNPGWTFKVNLAETYLNDISFSFVKIERTQNDWVICHVEKNLFTGAGGPLNLEEALNIFLDWAEAHMPDDPSKLHNYPP